jgi:hypothetical protein
MKNKTGKILITSIILALAACNTIPVSQVNTSSENAFNTTALSQSYLLRKLNRWIAEDDGPKMVKELVYAQFKHENTLRDIISDDTGIFDAIVAMDEVQARRDASPAFNLFIESLNSPPAIISTFAGDGNECDDPLYICGDGGDATSASLTQPGSLAVDSSGNVYIADVGIRKVRVVTNSDNKIETFAGNGDYCSNGSLSCGEGGDATNAPFGDINGLGLDGSDNLYILDAQVQKVRKITGSTINTVAGNGDACLDPFDSCGDGEDATSASLSYSQGIAVDTAGNIFIGDAGIKRVRKVNAADGKISTVAGNGEECQDEFETCGDGDDATNAALGSIEGVAVDSVGNIYIADGSTRKIKKVNASTGKISTVAGGGRDSCNAPTESCGDGGPATSARLFDPRGVAVDSDGNIYIADVDGEKVRKVSASTGKISTVAGHGESCGDPFGSCGDGGPATGGLLGNLTEIAMDGDGNFYINDGDTQKVKKITR